MMYEYVHKYLNSEQYIIPALYIYPFLFFALSCFLQTHNSVHMYIFFKYEEFFIFSVVSTILFISDNLMYFF